MSPNHRKLLLGTIAPIAVTVLTTTGASAQNVEPQEGAAQQPQAEEDNQFSLSNEIVVTARKKPESLQDAPLAVTAVTGDTLKFKNIVSGESLGQAVPSLSFSAQSPSSGSNASSQIFIRGIGQTDFLPTTEPGVGVYSDGVYFARATGSLFDFLDVEQVEVLRGPQGTLFGRNTIGGAILVRSAAPTDSFEGGAEVTLGSDNRTDVEGYINIPLSDSFSSRFAFLRKSRDGYVTRLATGQKVGDDNAWTFRGTLQWEPTSSSKITLIGDYTIEDENGSPLVFNSIGTGSGNAFNAYASVVAGCPGAVFLPGGPTRGVPNTADPRCGNNQFDVGPFATLGNFQTNSDFEGWGLNLTTEWDIGFAELKTITAYRESNYQTATDADNTPLDVFDRTNDGYQNQFSQEIQLAGEAFAGRMDWILGAFYFKETAEDINVVRFAGGGFDGPANLATNNLPGTVGNFSGGLGVESLGGLVENDNVALFAQTTFDITDRLHLTGGIRWTEENKAFTPELLILEDVLQGAQRAFIQAGCLLTPYDLDPNDSFADSVNDFRQIFTTNLFGPFLNISQATGCRTQADGLVKQSFTTREVTTHASIAFDVTDNINTYASFTEGFKAGGFSSRVISVGPGARPFLPESAKTFELGFKGKFADNRFSLNTALFQTNFEEIQIVIRQDFNPIIFNAGDATIKGFEAEFELLPTDELLITGSVGYVDASYDNLNPAVIAAGVSVDNRLPHTPKWNANASIAYNIETPFAKIVPRADYSYRGKIFFDANNSEAIASGAFHLLNLSLDVDLEDYPVGFNFGVTNVTNELYRVAGNQALGGAASYAESAYARPREFYARFRFDF